VLYPSYVDDPEFFYCPTTAEVKKTAITGREGMDICFGSPRCWPSEIKTDNPYGGWRMSYWDRGLDGGRYDPSLGKRGYPMSIVHPYYPYHWNLAEIEHPSNFALLTGVWHWDSHGTGFNAAYADGSARWIPDPDIDWESSDIWWAHRARYGSGGIIENTPNGSIFRKTTWEYIDRGAGGEGGYPLPTF
jgi:prepilin-type processing-associated H-X9-DG protein